MRGPLTRNPAALTTQGLIPAGAGTTYPTLKIGKHTRAHPRRCGDHLCRTRVMTMPVGSSPQVRGPRPARAYRLRDRGLIPAGAGTTSSLVNLVQATGAHPRRCGDHLIPVSVGKQRWGSSPQVRGPPYPAASVGVSGRLIPAGAGTTMPGENEEQIKTAHPRRCGDRCTHPALRYWSWGSSPQVRGPLKHAKPHRLHPGLIPAGAGTTGLPSALSR